MGLRIRLLALTDVHGNRRNLEEVVQREARFVDAIVFCGDAAPYSNPRDVDYLFEILDSLEIPSFVVPGNMDDPTAYRDTHRVKVIHSKFVNHNGYSIMGIGGSPPTPFGTVYELSEDEIWNTLTSVWRSAVEQGPVILVSHAPPYDTACDVAMVGRHVGSKSVRRFIEEHVPLLCICGHIHESRAIDRVGPTVVVNPGPLKNGFYAIIEVERFEVKRIELKKL